MSGGRRIPDAHQDTPVKAGRAPRAGAGRLDFRPFDPRRGALEPELGLGDFLRFTYEALYGHGGGYGTFYGTCKMSPHGSDGDGAPSILFQKVRRSGSALPPFASTRRFVNPAGALRFAVCVMRTVLLRADWDHTVARGPNDGELAICGTGDGRN